MSVVCVVILVGAYYDEGGGPGEAWRGRWSGSRTRGGTGEDAGLGLLPGGGEGLDLLPGEGEGLTRPGEAWRVLGVGGKTSFVAGSLCWGWPRDQLSRRCD